MSENDFNNNQNINSVKDSITVNGGSTIDVKPSVETLIPNTVNDGSNNDLGNCVVDSVTDIVTGESNETFAETAVNAVPEDSKPVGDFIKSAAPIEEVPIPIDSTPKKKKMIWSLIFIAANVLAIGIIALLEFADKSSENETLITVLQKIGDNWFYLIFALVCFLLTYVFEGMKISLMIKTTTKKWRPITSINTAVLGKYYDNITPLATGGQPFQIYYLRKRKIPMGVASAIPVASLFISHLGFAVIALIVFIFNGSVLNSTVMKVLAYVGSIFSFLVPVGIVALSFTPKLANFISGGIVKLLHKMKVVKDYEKVMTNVQKNVKEYKESLAFLSKSKISLIVGFFLSILSLLALYSIPYFVALACGAAELNFLSYINLVSLCFFVYSAVSFVPTPGTAGAAEVSFYAIFVTAGTVSVFWQMLIWRFISYFMYLIVGITLVITQSVIRNINHRRAIRKLL